jgi:hypothetical protein
MTTEAAAERQPVWLSIERKILELSAEDLSDRNLEQTVHRIAAELDNEGYNLSRHGGHMLQLRAALDARLQVGRPLMKDLNEAIAALKLEDLTSPYQASMQLVSAVGKSWPRLKGSEIARDVLRMVEKTRLDLLFAKARSFAGDEGIRFLIAEDMSSQVILEALDINEEKLGQVRDALEAERQERARVAELLTAVEGKPDEERVEHLINGNVSDELIIEMAGVDRGAIDGAKQAMAAALAEKRRLEEEKAARRKAEAEGPALEDISPDEMLEYIESIREILGFSDKESEIRVMCEQSNIPKSLVNLAVAEPDKLDELEEKAGG